MGKIESLGQRSEDPSETSKKRSLYFRGEERFQIASEKVVKVNEQDLHQEVNRLRSRRMDAYGVYRVTLSRYKQKDLQSAVRKVDPLLSEASSIRSDINSIVHGKVQATTSDYSLRYLELAGAVVDLQNETSKMQAITKQSGLNHGVKEFLNLVSYEVAGSADIAFGGVTLRDFANQTKKNKLPITTLLNYFVEGRMVKNQTPPELKNDDPLYAEEYPLLYKEKSIEASIMSTALLNSLPMAVPSGMRNKSREYSEVQQKYPKSAHTTDGLVKQVMDFSERFEETILDPNSEEFEEVSEAVWGYMKEPFSVSAPVLHSLTGGARPRAQYVYRQIQELTTDKKHGQFYSNLSETLKDFVEETSGAMLCLTSDDIEEIYTPSQDIPKPAPTLNELHDTILGLGSPPPKGEYLLEPEKIAWGSIAKPREVSMFFDKNTPMRFAIELGYSGDVEDFMLRLEADVKKKIFDWNVLEAPEDPTLKSFYESSLRVVQSSLEQLQNMKDNKLPNKEHTEVFPASGPIIPREKREKVRPHPESELLTKRQKRHTEKQLVAASEKPTPQSNSEIKKTIALPKDTTIEEFVRGHKLTNHAKERVLEVINAFNEEGVSGGFKRLRVNRHDRPKYRLRVTTADGDVRVVLRESESEEGKQKFEIEKIVGRNHRGDNYMEK